MQCPTHSKKLEKLDDVDPQKLCNICGRIAALSCKTCKYYQCQDCRVCLSRHFLIKIVDLNKVKKQYYNNSYACNSCSKSLTVSDDGIWHCNQCNYDLCPDCAE